MRTCTDCGVDISDMSNHAKRCSIHAQIHNKLHKKEHARKCYVKNKEVFARRNKRWREKNKEKLRNLTKAWRIKNKERMKELAKLWAKRNPEKVRQKLIKYKTSEKGKLKLKLYRQKNYEKLLEKARIWKKEHKEYVNTYRNGWVKTRRGKLMKKVNQIRHRARRKNAQGNFTINEWLEIRNRSPMCPACGRFVECENLTVDHIIPITKGGTNYISNIQPLCALCNSTKNNFVMEAKVYAEN